MMRTIADTSAAVDTEFIYDMCFAVVHADCLGRAIFDTVDTALAGILIKAHRTDEFVHLSPFLSL